MTFKAEIFSSTIVVIGSFNPTIFTPDWLEKNQLIGEGDAKVARENGSLIVSRQISQFTTESVSFQIEENRFIIANEGVISPVIKDLAASIFKLVLHTPCAAVGFNFTGHYKLNKDEYHHVGDVLAPKDIWSELYPKRSAGLQKLSILLQEGTRGELTETGDSKTITLQPSNRFDQGIELSLNDHHVLKTIDAINSTAEQVANIVNDQWETTWKESIEVFDKLLTKTVKD